MRSWLSALRRYLVATAVGHLAWEAAHVPLYGIWADGSATDVAFAVVHCTGGDLLIATAALIAALGLAGSSRWPEERFPLVAVLTLAFGAAYTVYSEWMNVSVRGTWSYAPSMPTLPPLGTGLSPALQWLAIPSVALASARRGVRSSREPAH